ncbi:hypothetical protein EFP84_04225 [Leptospira kmetyi]|uniref:Uncharacterized protein n=1 Tax=Leptospira kmetyi TaxID=408139 RepID=A0AAD0ULQ2_9LEPT|nr:hypothetical protein EFP84_04225 [Leptospira kmetyi]
MLRDKIRNKDKNLSITVNPRNIRIRFSIQLKNADFLEFATLILQIEIGFSTFAVLKRAKRAKELARGLSKP